MYVHDRVWCKNIFLVMDCVFFLKFESAALQYVQEYKIFSYETSNGEEEEEG